MLILYVHAHACIMYRQIFVGQGLWSKYGVGQPSGSIKALSCWMPALAPRLDIHGITMCLRRQREREREREIEIDIDIDIDIWAVHGKT